jgi:AcrR family transcriptional regulator
MEASTRERMLDAVVETILAEGFYRASSNRIAERAGVTWGVIQHHFGTREQLLLAVVHNSADEMVGLLGQAHLTGATVEERLASLADVVWAFYRRPQFLAMAQIVLNLSRDPNTTRAGLDRLAEREREVTQLWWEVIEQITPDRETDAETGYVIFEIIRGVAVGQGLIQATPRARRPVSEDEVKAILVRALATLLA